MKKIGLCLVAWLVACGGTGDTNIDGGNGNDGGPSDSASPDAPLSDSGVQDSAPPSDTGVPDGSTFNVQSLTGLVIWLKGDLSSSIQTQTPDGGGTAVVMQWTDQTSHHNDAKGLPEFPLRNPTVKANAINSLSAVHFDKTGANAQTGNMLNIINNADNSLQWGTGDFYVAIVADFDNDPTAGLADGVGNFFSKTPFSGASITGTAFFGNVPVANGTPTAGLTFETAAAANDTVTTATAYNNGAPHVFAIRRQSGKMDMFVDGASVASATPPSPIDQNNVDSVSIGAEGDANTLRLDGDIGEIIAVKDALAPSDQAGIEAYLKAKWATP